MHDALTEFRKFVDLIEGRAMACDGPVTPFLEELNAASDAERARFTEILHRLYTTPPAKISVADYAARLFDLHGFMLLETYRDKPAVTVTFPDLKEAQQFHSALVELSQHRGALATAPEDNADA